jgi:hypothetical protein
MKIETIKLKDIKISLPNRGFSHDCRQIISTNILIDGHYDWNLLIDSIKKEGFLPEKYGYITISKNGTLLDGHHRYTVLKNLYGENYEIKVIRNQMNYFTIVLFSIVILICMLPIKLFKILKNGFKYLNSYRTTKKKIS